MRMVVARMHVFCVVVIRAISGTQLPGAVELILVPILLISGVVLSLVFFASACIHWLLILSFVARRHEWWWVAIVVVLNFVGSTMAYLYFRSAFHGANKMDRSI